MVLPDDELHILKCLDDFSGVRRLIEDVSAGVVDQLDVRRIAPRLSFLEKVGEKRGRDVLLDRVFARRKIAEAAPAGRPVRDAGIAADLTDAAGKCGEAICGAMEMLAIERAPRCIAALEGGWL